jgi:hypothetical protein
MSPEDLQRFIESMGSNDSEKETTARPNDNGTANHNHKDATSGNEGPSLGYADRILAGLATATSYLSISSYFSQKYEV